MRRVAIFAGLSLAAPAFVLAQNTHSQETAPPANPHNVSKDESAYVVQAPVHQDQTVAQPVPTPNSSPNSSPASSKVYFPDEITPQSVARARAAQQAQLQQDAKADARRPVDQLSQKGEGTRDVLQVSDPEAARALAQLSEAEQQVLLEAVEGTDICARAIEIPAIRELCDNRIETRVAEFSQGQGNDLAEDTLLGGGLDSDRVATLEAALTRLAQNNLDVDNFAGQAIASVALQNNAPPDSGEAVDQEGNAEGLSTQTQTLINAIVQQVSN